MTQEQNLVETTDSKPSEDWMARRWRPLMGYVYMAICCCDFIVFPVLWSMVQAVYKIVPFVQWQPLTLQGAGLLHLAFGAILGVAAYGRTKEKMAGAEQGGLGSFGGGAGTTYVPPNSTGTVNVSNQPTFTPAPSFTSAPSFTPAPPPAFGGKPLGPGRAQQPEL